MGGVRKHTLRERLILFVRQQALGKAQYRRAAQDQAWRTRITSVSVDQLGATSSVKTSPLVAGNRTDFSIAILRESSTLQQGRLLAKWIGFRVACQPFPIRATANPIGL